MEFVEVVWEDAWKDDENFQTAHSVALTHKPMEVVSRGWLIVDNEVGVSIAGEKSIDTSGAEVFRDRSFIGRINIKSVTPYKLVKPRKPRKKNEEAKVVS